MRYALTQGATLWCTHQGLEDTVFIQYARVGYIIANKVNEKEKPMDINGVSS